jgi:hypothetical protein
MTPYCFKCNKEMLCLKSGFSFRPVGMDRHMARRSDLFYCPKCHSIATNKPTVEYEESGPDYANGKFTSEFIASRLEWYPDLTATDFETSIGYWSCHLHGPAKQVEPCCSKALPSDKETFESRMKSYMESNR